MPATPVTIDDVTDLAQDPFAAVGDILRDYNRQFVPADEHVPLCLLARDSVGKVQGGLRGRTVWGWCFVELLAVAEPLRGQGIGSQLLRRAEDLSKARGCVGVYLTTVAFQAPEFYKRLGYAQFGQLADYPPGFTQHWFAKRFDGASV